MNQEAQPGISRARTIKHKEARRSGIGIIIARHLWESDAQKTMREKSYRLRSSVLQDVLKKQSSTDALSYFVARLSYFASERRFTRYSSRVWKRRENKGGGVFQHPASSNLDWTANFLGVVDSSWDVAGGVWPDHPVVASSRSDSRSLAPH